MKPLSILAVDDSTTFLDALAALLENDGHAVVTATSGAQALDCLAKAVPDVILIDRVMPEMGGIETVGLIRKFMGDEWIPIIILTSSMDEAELQEAFESGADEFLLKPINALHLRIRLQSVMRISAMQRSTSAVISKLHDGVVRIDQTGCISLFNQAAESIFGYPASAVIGQNAALLLASSGTNQKEDQRESFAEALKSKANASGGKVAGKRQSGEVFPMHVGLTQVDTPEGNFTIGLVRDLSVEEALIQKVEHLAMHDALTGLPNRLSAWNHLEARYAKGNGSKPAPFAVFYCDLDGFKQINDELGHAAGDEVLIEVAKRVRSAMFVRDFLARLGGDEFAIVMDGNMTDARAQTFGLRVIEALKEPIATQFGEVSIGITMGYAFSWQFPDSLEQLVQAADQAMYAGKRGGKGRICGIKPMGMSTAAD